MRETGIPVGISQAVDAAEILTAVDLLDREQLRHGLAAVLVQRAAHRPTYDVLFDLWWPLGERAAGAAATPTAGRRPDEPTLDARRGARGPESCRPRCATQLARLLLEGRRRGAAAVRPPGRRPARAGAALAVGRSRSSATG